MKILATIGTLALLAGLAGTTPPAEAAIRGVCSDCHTMHNSQSGQSMADFGGESGPNPALTRGSCAGCHARGGAEKIVTVGPNQFPQVYHNDAGGDLAAGNFAYISGSKGSPGGASERKGHNVTDLLLPDTILTYPPGFRHYEGSGIDIGPMRLTCAGAMGCHGIRGQVLAFDEFSGEDEVYRTGLTALRGYEGVGKPFNGAHHASYDGKKLGGSHPDFANNPLAHSYRFIRGLKGYGNEQDRWQNASSTSHNEYFALSGVATDFSTSACSACHTGGQGGFFSRLTTPNMTMTGFCITCHGSFHSSGPSGSTAFLRHPADFVIKNTGEYALYTSYDLQAPVGRQELPAASSGVVTPGSDTVMCLSCHVAHASSYPSMLRWDYSGMIAGNAGEAAGTGCFVCHTTKDD